MDGIRRFLDASMRRVDNHHRVEHKGGEDAENSTPIAVRGSKLLVVGIGGSTRSDSSTERALRVAMKACARRGAATLCFGGHFLAALPYYAPRGSLTDVQRGMIGVLRRADAVILASPIYHGGISGLLKNALDTLDELNDDPRPFLTGRAVGCIVAGFDGFAGGSAMAQLRATVQALRGRPTPGGAIIDTSATALEEAPIPAAAGEALERVGAEVVDLARTLAGTRTMLDATLHLATRDGNIAKPAIE